MWIICFIKTGSVVPVNVLLGSIKKILLNYDFIINNLLLFDLNIGGIVLYNIFLIGSLQRIVSK